MFLRRKISWGNSLSLAPPKSIQLFDATLFSLSLFPIEIHSRNRNQSKSVLILEVWPARKFKKPQRESFILSTSGCFSMPWNAFRTNFLSKKSVSQLVNSVPSHSTKSIFSISISKFKNKKIKIKKRKILDMIPRSPFSAPNSKPKFWTRNFSWSVPVRWAASISRILRWSGWGAGKKAKSLLPTWIRSRSPIWAGNFYSETSTSE